MGCRRCSGLLYEDMRDLLFKCYQCGGCYYTTQPIRAITGSGRKRLTHGGRHYGLRQQRLNPEPVAA